MTIAKSTKLIICLYIFQCEAFDNDLHSEEEKGLYEENFVPPHPYHEPLDQADMDNEEPVPLADGI